MSPHVSVYAVMALLLLFMVAYRIERVRHERRRNAIPVRIWVNGTRGKSSVTRLIAAGLRAGEKKVIAKTTGTIARFITADNDEKEISRLGMANIREQIQIFKKACQYAPDAIVLECMALRPDLQCIESIDIIRPTCVVITNVRADHLDVMGPTLNDIAKAFIAAIPRESTLFTAQPGICRPFHDALRQNHITCAYVSSEDISDADMQEFSYIEHRENVALALKVCQHHGVERETALNGMYRALPDPGALQQHTLVLNKKKVTLIYAMAANDPDSTLRIWQSIAKDYAEVNVLVNCRDDRIDRSFQLAKLIKDHIHVDNYFITGKGTDIVVRRLYRLFPAKTVHNLGNQSEVSVTDRIADVVKNDCLIFAMGNTVGYGTRLIEFLTSRRG